jgi:branched-chain amino acid transport system permease protein
MIGVAGALMVFLWLGAAEAEAFDIDLSFQLLFIIIIGGLGSIVGAFFGAAIIHLMPIALRALPALVGLSIDAATIDQLTFMITGLLIILFLIVEPHGLARLWQTTKQKLRVWPFPY